MWLLLTVTQRLSNNYSDKLGEALRPNNILNNVFKDKVMPDIFWMRLRHRLEQRTAIKIQRGPHTFFFLLKF